MMKNDPNVLAAVIVAMWAEHPRDDVRVDTPEPPPAPEPIDLEPVGGYRPIPAPEPQSSATPWWRLLAVRLPSAGDVFSALVTGSVVVAVILWIALAAGMRQ